MWPFEAVGYRDVICEYIKQTINLKKKKFPGVS